MTENTGLALIDEAVELGRATKVYALFSGGHDSLTTTHLTSKHPLFAGVIHINTTIRLDAAYEFVARTCEQHGWALNVLRPNIEYKMLVLKYGFPGPSMHSIMYRYLKERPLMHFLSTIKKARKEKIVLAAGARTQESRIRMGSVVPIHEQGSAVWANPIHNYSGTDVTNYIAENGLLRSHVKDTMHISGECFCGCFAGKYERRELKIWFPNFEQYLSHLEAFIQYACELGIAEIPPDRREWGHGAGIAQEQTDFLPLCVYCRSAREDIDEQPTPDPTVIRGAASLRYLAE